MIERRPCDDLPRGLRTVLRMAVCCCLLACGIAHRAAAEDHVLLERDGARVHVRGRILVEAQDGGVLLLDRRGKLWTGQPDEIRERTKDEIPFEPLDSDALAAALLNELPEGFQTHATAHYLICYNTSKPYAQWCGALFERLYRAFINFWSRRGLKVHDPAMPMVAVVFADEESYRRYAVNELGDSVGSIIGYYNLLTNRVVMYDLTGAQALRQVRPPRSSSAEINRVLSRPEAGNLVATVIHEATHQIAFNCGLQTRLADIPIWLSEGIAMYFETPDLASSTGWRGLGAVNRNRLQQFRTYYRNRPDDSLETLLRDDRRAQGRSQDARFQGREAVLNTYGEAWCLTYYLVKNRPKEFNAYIEALAQKDPLFQDTPDERLAEFQRHFGDLKALDRNFIRQIGRLR